ncbi:MAG: hypothetical protein MUC60_11145 [Oscillatoria sp. Prado101]|nr:hypothetical protein [Oscillatoria sp. Prado101]
MAQKPVSLRIRVSQYLTSDEKRYSYNLSVAAPSSPLPLGSGLAVSGRRRKCPAGAAIKIN